MQTRSDDCRSIHPRLVAFSEYYPSSSSNSPQPTTHAFPAIAGSAFTVKRSVWYKRPPVSHDISLHDLKLKTVASVGKNLSVALKAIEERQESAEKSETANEPESETTNREGESSSELSQLGSKIKKALKERKEEKEGDLWSGVAEEIRETEWPAFGKVLGTTGVVLEVIAGSSVVLLTVHFVLAELSERVFAGRGVQDFFD